MTSSIAQFTSALTNSIDSRSLQQILAAFFADMSTLLASNQGILSASVTYDPPNLTTVLSTTTLVPVTGANIGDFVVASFSLDNSGINITGYVSAPGIVTVVFSNGTSGSVNLASGTLRVLVFPKASVFCGDGMLGASLAAAPGSLTTQTQAITTVTVKGAATGDFVMVSGDVDLLGLSVSAYVSAADTVKIVWQNNTAGTVNAVTVNVYVRVIPNATVSRCKAIYSVSGGTLTGTATLNPGALTTLTQATQAVTVTGCALGDYVICSTPTDLLGCTLTGYVSAASTVTLSLFNGTNGTQTVSSATAVVRTIPKAAIPSSTVLTVTA